MERIITVFSGRHEYFGELDGKVYHHHESISSTLVDKELHEAYLKSFKNRIYAHNWYDIYSYAMDGKSCIDKQEFIRRANERIETTRQQHREEVEARAKEAEEEKKRQYPVIRNKAWHRCAQSQFDENMVDDLLEKFDGRIISIKFDKKTLTGKTLPVQVSLRSGDYREMHSWIKENIKDINKYVYKQLFSRFGKAINVYCITAIDHLRDGTIMYQFDLKPEFIDKIKEAI